MSIFWKVYFVFWLALSGVIVWVSFAFQEEIGPWETYDYIAAALWPVGLLGLYGLAFRRRLGKANYWKVIFLIIFAIEVVYPGVEFVREWPFVSQEESNGLAFFLLAGLILVAPYYIGLYLYGWRSEPIWRSVP
jgi:hypothetical protein